MNTQRRAIEALNYINDLELDAEKSLVVSSLAFSIIHLQLKYGDISVSELELNKIIREFVEDKG